MIFSNPTLFYHIYLLFFYHKFINPRCISILNHILITRISYDILFLFLRQFSIPKKVRSNSKEGGMGGENYDNIVLFLKNINLIFLNF